MAAASGLERNMTSTLDLKNGISESLVAQISAAIYYKASVISKLSSNKAFQNKFRRVIYTQIEKDFSSYIDSQARTKPKTLHHVYEWKGVGNPDKRLFKLKMMNSNGISFRLTYEFKMSKTNVPTYRGGKKYKFANKAFIMENGIPVTISPKGSKRLVFNIDDSVVFMAPGASVTVPRPGGKAATNQFRLAYVRFFKGNLVNESIRRSGFQNIFNTGMNKSLRVPAGIKKVQYSFSPNVIRREADSALELAFGGAII